MPPQRSYVLRYLPVRGNAGGEPACRFVLQEAAPDAQRHVFVSIDELADFLAAELQLPRRGTRGGSDSHRTSGDC